MNTLLVGTRKGLFVIHGEGTQLAHRLAPLSPASR